MNQLLVLKRQPETAGKRGLGTAELCRQHAVSEQTDYQWKVKMGSLFVG
jgi:hypothetical protein